MNQSASDPMDPNSYLDFAEHPEDPYAKKGAIRVEFCMEAVQSEVKTAKEGRPIYDEVEFIRITYPGNKNSIVYREVFPLDKQRFRSIYEAWKSGQEISETGTPLEAWPYLSKAQIAELKHFNVRTVEDLANMADTAVQKFMGLYKLRKAAQDFLAAAENSAHTTKLRAEIEEREAKLNEMADRLSKLEAALAAKANPTPGEALAQAIEIPAPVVEEAKEAPRPPHYAPVPKRK